MKKIILGLITIVLITVMSVIIRQNSKKEVCPRIVLFTPITHPALEEIEQGFKQTLAQQYPIEYKFDVFNANGNKTLLRAQAEEIVAADYILIFTIGATCSQTIAELLAKKEINIPQVFAGVDGPEFAQSLQKINATTTGTYVKSDYRKTVEIIHALKPTAKNILLVYDPSHGTGLQKEKKEIEGYMPQYGFNLQSVEVYQPNEIQQKVASFLADIDVVLVLTDNTVVAGIDSLITLCNRYGVMLVASDLPSGKKGAALAYGVSEYESGSSAAQKAYEIVQGKKANEVPVSAVDRYKLLINKKAVEKQKLSIDKKKLPQLGVTIEC